jgi:hypothetical protein
MHEKTEDIEDFLRTLDSKRWNKDLTSTIHGGVDNFCEFVFDCFELIMETVSVC